jgi:hypothetical protein
LAEFFKGTVLCCERKSVVRSHRLWPQEATHPIFDREVTSLQDIPYKRAVALFKLSTVRALWILEQDHAPTGTGASNEDTTFRSMAGGRNRWISRVHWEIPPHPRLVGRLGPAAGLIAQYSAAAAPIQQRTLSDTWCPATHLEVCDVFRPRISLKHLDNERWRIDSDDYQ